MKLNIFKIQGTDKCGNPILQIFGKLFPGRVVSVEAVMKYLEEEIFPGLNGKKFSVVYMNSGVTRAENFPGIFALRWLYKAIPVEVRDNLESVYIVHPTFQCWFFLSTIGRLLFTHAGGLYCKLRFVYRLEFLWDKVSLCEFGVPKFVGKFDEELEYRPPLDLGMEGDHIRLMFWAPQHNSQWFIPS
ncbi:ganglioside-induced differentiation-associated protein 2-like [Dorcoceras hygrometricum]|uniref:Ganglioside-induced differentiation-associated protein 2-like n=1 Tax=Dorcoceras hygrometricum TaxID=472368 RepID=A0A2Z7AER4_9LAMI|nr:ganglioside-induced differentiation-associated protein 2-like [Dorcoceras hygrometricum]